MQPAVVVVIWIQAFFVTVVLLRCVFYAHCIYFYSASAFLSTSQLRYIVGNFWSCIFFVERKYFSRIMVHRFQNKSKFWHLGKNVTFAITVKAERRYYILNPSSAILVILTTVNSICRRIKNLMEKNQTNILTLYFAALQILFKIFATAVGRVL